MQSPVILNLDDYVYRRLRKGDYNRNTNNVKAAAFVAELGESLSVFAPTKTPREVLQAAIDDQNAKLASPDENVRLRAQTWLANQGDTVPKMVSKGWCVAKIKVSEFIKQKCHLDEVEPNGHINVWYPDPTVMLQSTLRSNIADEAILLTEAECLL